MSINGVGASGAADPGQLLARMLSRLDSTNNARSSNASTANTGSSSATTGSSASTALTGTAQSALSDQVMALLVHLQQTSPSDATPAGTAQPQGNGDAIQQLFSAMDADGNGSVSQTELEKYIGNKGGTQAEAHALFSSLNQTGGGQNGSPGISEQQLGIDVAQTKHSGHGHHHHGGGASGPPASNSTDITAQIFGSIDTNQDGDVSADEFSAAFNAGNSASAKSTGSIDPSAMFSKIDVNSDGSVTSDELGSFITSLANQAQSDFNTLGMFGQLASQSYDASAGLLNKTTSGQSSYA